VDETPTGVRLQRFPVGQARTHVYRWLARRRVVIGIAWYFGILIPGLVLVVLAARVHDLLGFATLVVGGTGVVVALVRLRRPILHCRDLAERMATVRDHSLVIGPSEHIDLHSGRTSALEPGAVRGYGRAHLLAADGRPCLLLSDPRTEEPRAASELRALIEALQTSTNERDRDTARILWQMSSPFSSSDPAPVGKPPIIWRAVDGLGWTVLVFAVVPTVALAGGAAPDSPGPSEEMTGQALGLISLFLVGIWVLYAFGMVSLTIGTWLGLSGRQRGQG
jgi:hypothetical protein